ncbi:YfjI family protein [Acetobacterium bakii]|uniref:DNA primase n=1 Tax=Acetobacterium bakii TaxID=52689 RepID=A0A0L6TYR1_9FIRM|nr:YfjI family protein [Acetobacterium bakii]KNZ41394.1 hypothetical protein AKG39_12305 [Acetobacterium bakii]
MNERQKEIIAIMEKERNIKILEKIQVMENEDHHKKEMMTINIDHLITNKDLTIQWEKPKPLKKEVMLPSFPLDSLPSVVSNYVKAVSESTATPIDMCAVASLAVIAGTIQGKYRIRGKPDYFEPLNLYTVIIANPGERKSAIINAMTKHVHEYEREINKERQSEIDRQRIELNAKEKQIKLLEDRSKVDEAYILKTECRELEAEQIKPLRLIADDVTAEALTSLLADNDGKLSVISAEGGFFDTLAGKYSNTVSIDTVLKAHCGDSIGVDRRGRPREYIPNPTLTILLAVQSNVIEGMFDNGTFKGRGLTARFLYCKPNSMVGHRGFDTIPIKPIYELTYRDLIYSLLEIKNDDPIIIKLSAEATDAYRLFYEDIEKRQQEGNDLNSITDFASKLHGAVLRISGLLHCMDYERLINNEPVSMVTMANAMDIGGYFLKHSMNAYNLMGADDQMKQVRFVLRKLEQNPLEQYKKNEILIMCRNPMIKVTSDLEPILEILIDHGYLLETKPDNAKRSGRKSATIYELNPLHFNF